MKIFIKRRLVLCFLILTSTVLYSSTAAKIKPSDYSKDNREVDKVISSMSVREKIAQLFIVSFSSNLNDRSTQEALDLIVKEKIGGVIIMNSSLTPGVKMINRLQELSKIPLLVTIDGEWGASMRFDSVLAFPRQMQLGALEEASLIYKMGFFIGEQAKRLGIDLNYAPTIDINSNPSNPVINTRSFGQNRKRVADYGLAYAKGMQDAGVAGSAKHFPGHGDTDTDSHYALPLLSFSKERIDSLELYPFKALIESGIETIMVGHLQIPSLDSSGRPSSISKKIVSGLLRGELEYGGIIVTDALNMKGVSTYMAPELLPLEAYRAGSDLILMPEKVSQALDIMEQAVKRGEISEHSLNVRCRKMLELKRRLGILNEKREVNLKNLYEDVNKGEYFSLVSEISDRSLILLKNDNIIPIKNSRENIGFLSIGGDRNGGEMANHLLKYYNSDTIILRGNYKQEQLKRALNHLEKNETIIIAIHNTDSRPQRDFGLNISDIELLTSFAKKRKVIFVYFGNPLAIPFIQNHENFAAIIVAHSNTIFNNISAVNIVSGVVGAAGRMPVSAGKYNEGYFLRSEKSLKPRFGVPLDLWGILNVEEIKKNSDSIILKDLKDGGFKRAKLVMMYKNDVLFEKQYGDKIDETSFDLKNISSILSTLPAIATLNSTGVISLEDFAGSVPKFKRDKKYSAALLSDLLMHRIYDEKEPSVFPKFSIKNIEILNEVIEYKTGTKLDEYVESTLLNPLSMSNTVIDRGNVSTNTNDILKLLFVLRNNGLYGDKEVLQKESVDLIESFMHYHSNSDNGSIVWFNRELDISLIFISDGVSIKNIEESSLNTGRDLKRSIEQTFSNLKSNR